MWYHKYFHDCSRIPSIKITNMAFVNYKFLIDSLLSWADVVPQIMFRSRPYKSRVDAINSVKGKKQIRLSLDRFSKGNNINQVSYLASDHREPLVLTRTSSGSSLVRG